MTGEISRKADARRLARCVASAMAALVVCGSALANDADAIRKRLRYVGTLDDVAWFEVRDHEVHIGFHVHPEDNLDILNGAVAGAITATGRKHEIIGYAYDAATVAAPRENGDGATCKSRGKQRVEETRCLRDGRWIKPRGVKR